MSSKSGKPLSGAQAKQRVNDLVATMRGQRKTVIADNRSREEEIRKRHVGIPVHELWSRMDKDVDEAKYYEQYRDFYLEKTDEATSWISKYDERLEQQQTEVRQSFFLTL